MRTGMAGSSLLLTLVWVAFAEASSSRSGSGLAAGIWCSGIIFIRGSRADGRPRWHKVEVSRRENQATATLFLEEVKTCDGLGSFNGMQPAGCRHRGTFRCYRKGVERRTDLEGPLF